MKLKNGEEVTLSGPSGVRYKYESALAEYAYLQELDWSGDVASPVGAYAVIGRRVVREDGQGFVTLETYGDERGARAVVAAYEYVYGVWSDDEEYGAARDQTRYQHDLALAERYVEYVLGNEMNNLESYEYDVWLSMGQPPSYLGNVVEPLPIAPTPAVPMIPMSETRAAVAREAALHRSTTPAQSMYAITATVTREGDWGKSMRQIPTFYLGANVQGIVSEAHAQQIAMEIIDPWGEHDGNVFVTAVKL